MALDTNKIFFGGMLKCGLFSLFQGSGLVGRKECSEVSRGSTHHIL